MKRTAAAAALLLIILIFLPVPLRIDKELKGRRIAGNAAEETAVIQLHGWRFHYLIRKDALDTLRANVKISPFPQKNVLDFSFSEPVLSHDGVYAAYGGADKDLTAVIEYLSR